MRRLEDAAIGGCGVVAGASGGTGGVGVEGGGGVEVGVGVAEERDQSRPAGFEQHLSGSVRGAPGRPGAPTEYVSRRPEGPAFLPATMSLHAARVRRLPEAAALPFIVAVFVLVRMSRLHPARVREPTAFRRWRVGRPSVSARRTLSSHDSPIIASAW